MEPSLKGKVALITGASRGIGLAIAQALAASGMSVALTARSEAALRAAASKIESTGARALAYPADLALIPTAAQFVDAALAAFGRIDLLVNNAGATKRGDF